MGQHGKVLISVIISQGVTDITNLITVIKFPRNDCVDGVKVRGATKVA